MIDPFQLFCAYHLGLDDHGKVRFQNGNDVARRFGVSLDDVTAALERYGMDAARMLELDFDLAGARLDIEVSPPGVDLPSIALMHYELFLQAPPKPRDWEQERQDDERENERTYGRGAVEGRVGGAAPARDAPGEDPER